jgi:hypothetical protein
MLFISHWRILPGNRDTAIQRFAKTDGQRDRSPVGSAPVGSTIECGRGLVGANSTQIELTQHYGLDRTLGHAPSNSRLKLGQMSTMCFQRIIIASIGTIAMMEGVSADRRAYQLSADLHPKTNAVRIIVKERRSSYELRGRKFARFSHVRRSGPRV